MAKKLKSTGRSDVKVMSRKQTQVIGHSQAKPRGKVPRKLVTK